MGPTDNELKPSDEEIYIDLRQMLKILGKWSKFIIVLTLLAGLAVGLISHYVLTPIYQADTLLRFSQATEKLQTNPSANTGGEIDAYTKPILTMNTHLTQIKSRALMQRITDALALEGYSVEGLAGMIDASVVKDSNLIQVKVTNADPVLVAKIANTLSDQYMRLMNEKTQEQINSSVTFLTSQKELTDGQLVQAQEALREYNRARTRNAAEREILENEIERLQTIVNTLDQQISATLIAKSVDLGESSMVIMSAAAVPTSPIKPKLVQNVAIALLLGLILFTLLAFLLEYLDNTVKTADDFRDMELPVLGIIPETGQDNSNLNSYGGW